MSSANILAASLTGLSLTYFLFLGLRSSRRIKSLTSYFLADRNLDESSLSNTIAASGLSNGTVALAYLQIFPSFGYWTFIAFAANFAGHILFISLINKVTKTKSFDIGQFTTVGDLVFGSTESNRLSNLVDSITFISFLAALLVELVIGAQLFVALLPDLPFAEYIGFLVTSSIIVLYIVTGGFIATVESDSWQMRIILSSSICFVIFLLVFFFYTDSSKFIESSFSFDGGGLAPNTTIILWAINTIFLSVLFPIGQLTSWQRIASTQEDKRIKGLWKGLRNLTWLWLTFAFAGFVFAYKGIAVGEWGVVFSAMEKYGGIHYEFFYPILFAGLVAAVISTADSNAVAVIFSRFSGTLKNNEVDWQKAKKKIRNICYFISIVLVVFFIAYTELGQKNTLLNLIFALFGLYLLLVPIVSSIVLGRNEPKSEKLIYFTLLIGVLVLAAFCIPGMLTGNLSYVLSGNLIGFFISCIFWI